MTSLILFLSAAGLAPLVTGLALLQPSKPGTYPPFDWSSVLLCALAFNLTFFWQELWLVLPKAMMPQLHPVLYHNNHDWTGVSPHVELLQASGAVATLTSGLAFCAILVGARLRSAGWRLFVFWMAVQGTYQALSQLAIGSFVPGNDVGRALGYLELTATFRTLVLVMAILGMALAGGWLARRYPGRDQESGSTRRLAWSTLMVLLIAVAVVIPFRVPRNIVEVVLIPLIVHLLAAGWLILGMAVVKPQAAALRSRPASIAGPLLALGAVLLFFQLVLRPGIAF